MQYPIEHYDHYGYLKPSLWLWFGWLFLARAWLIFIIAGVSREQGEVILTFIYPDRHQLYWGLVVGLPSIVLMWLVHLRQEQRHSLLAFFQLGYVITLLTVMTQLIHTLHSVYLEHGAFNWLNAFTLVILLWLGWYLLRSRRVRACFYAGEPFRFKDKT